MATLVTYYRKPFIYQAFSVALSVAFSIFLMQHWQRPYFLPVAVLPLSCRYFSIMSTLLATRSNPFWIPCGPYLRFDRFGFHPLIPLSIWLISLLSVRFIYLASPPKHSVHISNEHTLSLSTSSVFSSRWRFPFQNCFL